MNGLILKNAYWESEATDYQANRLSEEFSLLGVHCDIRRNVFSAMLRGGKAESLMGRYDFCVYLDKDKYVSHMLEEMDLVLFNSADSIEKCDDKMTTQIQLAGRGLPMPDTLPGLLCYSDAENFGVTQVAKVEAALGYPMIIKRCYGSLGSGVYKIDDREKLISTVRRLKNVPHLFQKYISTSQGRDVRAIVIDGKAVGGIMRKAARGFRANLELGGEGTAFDLPAEYKRLAEFASKILGLHYCGIDFLIGEDGAPLLSEVNSNAFFGGFERSTGINVAGIYAKHIAVNISKYYGIPIN